MIAMQHGPNRDDTPNRVQCHKNRLNVWAGEKRSGKGIKMGKIDVHNVTAQRCIAYLSYFLSADDVAAKCRSSAFSRSNDDSGAIALPPDVMAGVVTYP